ncbi:Prolipoprotein diacylglyceryl transferase [Ferriphaselus amnicola]|uniref:Phosphatidylglycerol--prolipoprotein diacylglyceryl transferase n=1 Tax=Ferriphaselus amnicola TaxID=1188319 RepID=A0A2Z6GFY6_9PROT|nr:prolipoprotein diacylglyceryl transferase [Ferriphaselus amnicola]BBE52075.1 Prolipoprotein diacylglyceryl transferase [Ferriphaselus amnicola]
MLTYPKIDPVALQLGPLAVHWYGLMYLTGFACFLWLGRKRLRTLNRPGWDEKFLDDLMFFGVLGVILGGRLGEVLFYNPGYYFSHPAKILAVWEGGMSFHGGFLGVLVAMAWFARSRKVQWLPLMDFVAPLVPLGLGAGRIGNFINGELWGRPTDVPWAMVFPTADTLPRHPSQLYEFALEGLALFSLLWIFSSKPRPVGAVSGLFLIGYGSFRFLAEFTRNPDDGIFGLMSLGISMGQWLSLPMVLVGIAMMRWSRRAV